jgi:hypothetical protein
MEKYDDDNDDDKMKRSESLKLSQKKYYQKNRLHIRMCQQKYYNTHKEEINQNRNFKRNLKKNLGIFNKLYIYNNA